MYILPRVRRHRVSEPQGSSKRVLPWQVTMDQIICASLSHTHYWYEVGMLEVPGQPASQTNRDPNRDKTLARSNQPRTSETYRRQDDVSGYELQFLLSSRVSAASIS